MDAHGAENNGDEFERSFLFPGQLNGGWRADERPGGKRAAGGERQVGWHFIMWERLVGKV